MIKAQKQKQNCSLEICPASFTIETHNLICIAYLFIYIHIGNSGPSSPSNSSKLRAVSSHSDVGSPSTKAVRKRSIGEGAQTAHKTNSHPRTSRLSGNSYDQLIKSEALPPPPSSLQQSTSHMSRTDSPGVSSFSTESLLKPSNTTQQPEGTDVHFQEYQSRFPVVPKTENAGM